MPRFVLDTNILSTLMKPQPPEPLLRRMAAQADDDLFIAAVAEAHACIVASENERDFYGLAFGNPSWAEP